MSEPFKFTPAKLDTPWDNLTAAIGIIQTEILASDTGMNPNVIFGNCHFKLSSLKVAVALLAAITEPVEDLAWNEMC